jgi:glycosyltransferase involved in cell wall biosynthesis
MKILTLSYEFPPIGGGGSRVVHGLTKELVRLGHQVDLVTMGFRGLPRIEDVNGVTVYRVPCVRLQKSICRPPEMLTYLVVAFPYLLRLIRQGQYDVNHTHFIFPDALLSYALKKITGLPYVITAHGSDVPGYNPNRFKALHRILKPIWKVVVENADMIISPSKSLAQLISLQLPTTQIQVIPNGIDIEPFNITQGERNRILVVSRFFERKGVQYFLRASIFVFPSEAENFPIVLLEAMIAGLAIITTKDTGCEEVVGEKALLVKPRDSDGIRMALERLADNPELCVQLGRDAQVRVSQEFSWEIIANRYMSSFTRITKSSP